MTEVVLPADWEAHERCLMAWAGEDLVSTRLLTAVKKDYALVARAVSEFEPVLMVARPGFGREAEAYCGHAVDVVELPLRAAWLRDIAYILVPAGAQALRGEPGAEQRRGYRDTVRRWPASPPT